jgi:hypothetical protein
MNIAIPLQLARNISFRLALVLGLVTTGLSPRSSHADEPTAAGGPAQASPGEAEFLVPPQGGAFEIPIHVGKVVILSFPEKMAKQALTSSNAYDIKAWGKDGVAVRAIFDDARPATLALSTEKGMVKVNVTLRVVGENHPALTLVRFKGASAEEAFTAAVQREVARQTIALTAELKKTRADIAAQSRDLADREILLRLLGRHQSISLHAIDRNDDNVIVRVTRGAIIGDDGYLFFEIENRSSSGYPLATVAVRDGTRDVAQAAVLAGGPRAGGLLGLVPARGRSQGVVIVRDVGRLLTRPLVLQLSQPGGQGEVTLHRGIVLR